MDAEEVLDHVKINIERLGLWFWFFLFGFLDAIFSIIYRPEYIALGLYFFACGVVGVFITMLLDKFSSKRYASKDDKGNRTIDPPLYYAVISFVIRLSVFAGLCFVILKKYPDFCPFSM
jgi:hypothetical protein